MPLPGTINDAHSAASDFFQDLIFAQPPIGVAHFNFTEHVLERFICLTRAVGVPHALREQTPQTKSRSDAPYRPTLWADDLFLLQTEGNRNAVHRNVEKLKR